jgi:hypothetical protein
MSAIKTQKLYGINGTPGTSPYAQIGDNGELYSSTFINSGPFYLNSQTIGSGFIAPSTISLYNSVTSTWTIPANYNAMSAGKVTINSGITVNVATGARWVIV